MSKLDELIAEYCPNGVAYKSTKELASDSFWLMPATPQYVDEGVPYITSKNIKNGKISFEDVKYITENDYREISKNRPVHKGDMLITMIGTIGEVAIVGDEPPFYGQNIYLVRLDNSKILTKYYYYFITSNRIKNSLISKKNASSQGYIKAGSIEQLKVPVPPKEVQREIVHILDEFTLLTSELSAELSARRKQYEFYRDKLLHYDVKSREMTILDMLSQPITDGPHETPTLVADGVPFLSAEAIVDNRLDFSHMRGYITREYDAICAKKYKPQKNDVYMCKSGSTTGKVAINDTEADFNIWSPLAALRVNEENNAKYLFYLLQSQTVQAQVKMQASHGSQPNLSMRKLEQIKVIVPPKKTQDKIVDVLDNFESICNDLNIGLPAEIDARQKQYEYYRDLLLTFAETGDSVLTDRQSIIKLLQYVFGYAPIPLSELFNTRNGYTPSKSNSAFWTGDTTVPWFRMEDIRENGRVLDDSTQHVTEQAVKGEIFPEDSIIISTSATIGEHAWIRVPSLANQRFTYLMLKPNYKELIDSKYIFYYCFKLGDFCRNHLNQGNFASVDMSSFGDFVFMIPTKEKQVEIAEILDRFDKLCNDISEGIPAEIEARQKQYEYYRDKLLTFEEA